MPIELKEPTNGARDAAPPNESERGPAFFEAGLGGPLVLHGRMGPGYSYRSVAELSKRGQERTWPATAQ